MAKKDWTFEEIEGLYRQLFPRDVDGEGKQVLVADDSAPMRSVICAALKKSGFDAVSAPNGLQALQKIRKNPPDLCILDVNMPQATGFDILEAMRGDPKYASIPVILCTARKERSDILMAQKLQASAYIMKPFQMEDLLKKVAELLGE